MRKVFSGISTYAFLSIISVMVLGACVKPVGVKDFLNDDTVIGIIRTGGDFDVDYEHPKDNVPVLEIPGIGTINEGDTVTVSLGSSGGVTIEVTNDADYDTIEWYYDNVAVESGPVFTVDITTPPFDTEGEYPVTVVGTAADGISYSLLFYIIVEKK
jgi:hypothetical protein